MEQLKPESIGCLTPERGSRLAPRSKTSFVRPSILGGELLVLLAIADGALASDADARELEVRSYLSELDSSDLRRVTRRPPAAQLLATEPAPPETEQPGKRWHGLIEVYVWAPLYASGSIVASEAPQSTASAQTGPALTGGGPDLIDVDSISGVLIPIRSRWRYGRWGVRLDFTYGELEPEGTLLGGLDIPFKLDVELWFLDLAALYVVVEPEVGKQPWLVDFFLGARVVGFKQESAVGTQEPTESSDTYLDPLIGVDLGYEFSKSWAAYLRLDASGFGVSGGSNATLSGLVGVLWRFGESHNGLVNLGWRWMRFDFGGESGVDEIDFDLQLHGPFLGFGYTF